MTTPSDPLVPLLPPDLLHQHQCLVPTDTLLADAVHRVRALAGALAELREGAELPTTGLYLDLVRDGLADLSDWLGDAIGELKATPTPAEEAAFRAEQAGLRERLWRR